MADTKTKAASVEGDSNSTPEEGEKSAKEAKELDERGVPKDNRIKELERKLAKKERDYGNAMAAQMARIQQLEQMVSGIASGNQRSGSRQDGSEDGSVEKLSELFIEDPKKAVSVMKSLVEKELSPKFEAKISELDFKYKQRSADEQAVAKYPDLLDNDSEFTERFNGVVNELVSNTPSLKNAPNLSLLAAELVSARYPNLVSTSKTADGARHGGYSAGSALESNRGGSFGQYASEAALYGSAAYKNTEQELTNIVESMGFDDPKIQKRLLDKAKQVSKALVSGEPGFGYADLYNKSGKHTGTVKGRG